MLNNSKSTSLKLHFDTFMYKKNYPLNDLQQKMGVLL